MDPSSPADLADCALSQRRIEYQSLADSFVQMVYCRTLPPNDAYAWTVIVARMASAVGLRLPDDVKEPLS